MPLREIDVRRLASIRVTTRSICSRRRVTRCEPVKTSRFRTIFGGAIRVQENLAQLPAHGSSRLGGVDEQLEMPQHALERVVHLVRDPGDELSERRELFGLGQPRAQRFALALEARLSRDVAGDEDPPDRLRFLVDERRRRQQESAAEPGVLDRRRAGGRWPGGRIGRLDPERRLLSHEIAERTSDRVVPRHAGARGERVVGLDDLHVAIGDDDQIDERVEGVFEQAPLPQDLLEQLDVLDAGRQLVSELVREVDELHFVEVAAVHAAQDQRAERTPPAAERCDEDAVRQSGAIEPQAARRRVRGVFGRDPDAGSG